uniref:Uncharacterized protein n=1 Tax=Oryza brachyantha TaxID=4533 RepID=J3N8T2_ORYBR
MGKGRRDGVWTGNRGVTKAYATSGFTKAQERTARLGVKEGGLIEPSLPSGGDDYLEDVHDGAPGAPLVAVPPGVGEEDGDGDEHGISTYVIGLAPVDVVMDVYEHGDGEQRAEEDAHGGVLLVVAVVELVGAEPSSWLLLTQFVTMVMVTMHSIPLAEYQLLSL